MTNPPVEDYYTLLGVARDASADEIKRRFRKLARECHPDVAGDDPSAAARFNQIRQAYETLSDPEKRHRYDNPPRRTVGGTFYRRSWRPPGGNRFDGLHNGSPGKTTRTARDSVRQRFNDPGNQLDLDDIFSDLGGGSRPRPAGGASSRASSSRSSSSADPYAERTRSVHSDLREMMNGGGAAGPAASRRRTPREAPAGADITLAVEVPDHIAREGGTVSVKYPRLKRGERGPTLFRYDEIHELRVPSSTRHGQTLRVSRMGNAGDRGGAYGDLVCRVQIVQRAPPHGDGTARARPGTGTGADAGDEKVVDISVVEALLGGRIELVTPSGRVRVTVPAGTSSDTRMRLRGRGRGGADLFVRLRVVVPRTLDAESRSLIEQFAALNPDSPRD